jgi:hypothetical protein
MEFREQDNNVIEEPQYIQEPYGQMMPMGNMQQRPPGSELFTSPSNLEVIKEYNNEESIPNDIKLNYWAMSGKGIKLGFWEKEDEVNLFIHRNMIYTSKIMSKPKFKYTFKDLADQAQLSLMFFTDFKRGMGMEKYKINERTLQSASIQQSIQGSPGQSPARKGFLGSIKSWFS